MVEVWPYRGLPLWWKCGLIGGYPYGGSDVELRNVR
jgi:hypothetical protein